MKMFRFRGREERLLLLFRAFREHPGRAALHPADLARATDLSLVESATLMDDTPELFIRLRLHKGGNRHYRLATSIAARSDAEIEAMVVRRGRMEQFTVLSVSLIAILAVVVLVLPWLPWIAMQSSAG